MICSLVRGAFSSAAKRWIKLRKIKTFQSGAAFFGMNLILKCVKVNAMWASKFADGAGVFRRAETVFIGGNVIGDAECILADDASSLRLVLWGHSNSCEFSLDGCDLSSI